MGAGQRKTIRHEAIVSAGGDAKEDEVCFIEREFEETA